VAYTSQARIYVRDLAAETTRAVAAPGGAPALDPALSGDGSVVAYTAVVGGRPRVLACDLHSGVTQIVSRASGATGAVADGIALAPSISADGTRVAFASTAGNLSADKRDDTRGVFVRDLPSAMTTLVSAPSATR
jgi:Tol biopolymer transport system component